MEKKKLVVLEGGAGAAPPPPAAARADGPRRPALQRKGAVRQGLNAQAAPAGGAGFFPEEKAQKGPHALALSPASAFRSLDLKEVFSLKDERILAKRGSLVSATTEGFVLRLPLSPQNGNGARSADKELWGGLIDQPIAFVIADFEVELRCVVRKLLFKGSILDVYTEFLAETPLYYKQCVADLLH